MNYLEAVNAALEAASEPKVATLVSPNALTTKFMNMVNEAYRTANTMKRWPWTKESTSVTATADPHAFTLASNVLEIIMVTHLGIPLNNRYSYEDLVYLTQGSDITGIPSEYAQQTFDTIWMTPSPNETTPEANIVVYAYTTIPDLAVDADVLEGPVQYHDAVVNLADAIASLKHFGDEDASAKKMKAVKEQMRSVWSKSRQHKPRAGFRI